MTDIPQERDIKVLSDAEINEVAGGIAPLAYAGIVVGLKLLAVASAVRDLKSRR